MRLLKGKPLLQYAIEAAVHSHFVERVFVSTDSKEYRDFVWKMHDEFSGKIDALQRPARLAEDVPTEDVIIDALDQMEKGGVKIREGFRPYKDCVIILQCTTPLMTGYDIDSAFKVYQNGRHPSVVSVTDVREYPQWMFKPDGLTLNPILGVPDGPNGVRQNLEPLFRPNGAIYITAIDDLRKNRTLWTPPTGFWWMPPDKSWDVDNEIDLKILEALAGE
jgi:CMP-N,N'-diacetyllegionaminic acid synthase